MADFSREQIIQEGKDRFGGRAAANRQNLALAMMEGKNPDDQVRVACIIAWKAFGGNRQGTHF